MPYRSSTMELDQVPVMDVEAPAKSTNRSGLLYSTKRVHLDVEDVMNLSAPKKSLSILRRSPAGFRYVEGTSGTFQTVASGVMFS